MMREPRRRSPESSRRRRRDRRDSREYLTNMPNATTADFNNNNMGMPYTTSPPTMVPPMDSMPRGRAGSSSSSSSSVASSLLDISRRYPDKRRGNAFMSFFTASSDRRRRRRKSGSSKRRVLYFNNSSSSSINSDLAYGHGYIPRMRSRNFKARDGYSTQQRRDLDPNKPGTPRRSKTDEEILSLGRQLSDIARQQNEEDLRAAGRSRPSGLMSAAATLSDFRKKKHGDKSRGADMSRGIGSSRPDHGSSGDASDWESASEDESSSDEELAYGSVVSHALKPTMAAAAGAAAGAAFASSGSRPSDSFSGPERKSSIVDPRLFGPYNSLRGMVNTPCGFEDPRAGPQNERNFRPPPRSMTDPTGQAPMRNVYPIPTSDPARFDVDQSVTSSRQDLPTRSRPGPVPIQQPVPKAPVSSKVYDAERLEEAGRRDSRDSRRRSDSKGWGEAAAAGAAAAAVGAVLASDRGDDRKDDKKDRRKDSRDYRDDESVIRRDRDKRSDKYERSERSDKSDKRDRDSKRDRDDKRDRDGKRDRDDKRDRDGKRRESDGDKERRKSKRDSYSDKYPDEKDHKRSSRTDDWEDVPSRKRREVAIDQTPDKVSYKSRGEDIQVEYDRDARSEVSRSSRRDSRKYDDRKYEDRKYEDRKSSDRKYDDRKYDDREEPRELSKAPKAGDQNAKGANLPTQSSTIDPFQYQVASDAFMTPQFDMPTRPLTPTVVTVDREPNFDNEPLAASGSDSRLSRKDSFEIERMVEDYRKGKEVSRSVDPRKNHEYEEEEHQASDIYDQAKHATVPVAAAAVASAIAVEGERSRERRRKQFSTDGSRDRSRGPARDTVQEEADRYYRETVIARKIASDEAHSRSVSPEKSVVNKYEDDDADIPTIVTPPGMERAPVPGPYDAPNADVRIDNQIFPKESSRFRSSSKKGARTFKSRDPSCERDRPLLNLVFPTPVPSREPTPAPEKWSQKEEETRDRGGSSSKSDVSQVAAVPRGGATDSSITSKSVTWGENETNLYEVETPEPKAESELYRGSESAEKPRPRLNKSSAWGVIAAAIAGSSSEPDNEPDVVVSESGKVISPDRGVSDSPKSSQFAMGPDQVFTAETSSAPPVPGPKPSSSKSDQMPGGYADDIEFAATLAAGLKDTGFDPNIVIEDPAYRRRDSPPGSDELNGNGWYQRPFSETVTDLGHEAAAAKSTISDTGFVIGEVDTPKEEQATPDDGWAEIPANLSKKEKKRREKLAKRQSVEVTDSPTVDSPKEPAAAAPEEFPDIPVKLSKKEQRKREKEAKARALAEEDDFPMTTEPEPIEAPAAGEEVWEESSKKKSKKNRRSRDFDDSEPPKVSVPVDAFDDLQSSREVNPGDEWDTKKSKKKSKRDSANYDSRSVEPSEVSTPVDTVDDLQSSREINTGEEWDTKKSKKKSSKRDSASYDTQSVEPSEVSVEGSSKKSSKSKRRSGTEDDFDEYGDGPLDRRREDPFEDRDVTSVVSESRYDDRRRDSRSRKRSSKYDDDDAKSVVSLSGSRRRSSKYDDDDDTRSVASAPGGSRKSKDSEKRSSGGLFSSIFKSNGHKEEDKKESFLDNAGTLGAGAGLAGAAVAVASSLSRSNATEPSSDKDQASSRHSEQAWDDDVLDPEIAPRAIKPAIDPQYGDLLPLPPSEPGSPIQSPEELPGLPDSRPDTPPEERNLKREHMTHQRRRSAQETPVKSPSHTAIPIALRMGQRGPSSPGTFKSSPITSPITPAPESGGGARRPSRPTSWDSSRGMKPLLLPTHLREGATDSQAKELEFPVPQLGDPPATKQALESSGDASGLRIATDIPLPEKDDDAAGSQDTTPKAEVRPELPVLPTAESANWDDELPAEEEPDPIDPVSKNRSSYLLNSTPSSLKSNKSATEEALAQSPYDSTPSKQRGLDAPLSDIAEDFTSADEHFSDALEGQTDDDTFEDTRDFLDPSPAQEDVPEGPPTPVAIPQAAPTAVPDDWNVAEDRPMTAKEKKKAKKARKNKELSFDDIPASAEEQPVPVEEAPPSEKEAATETAPPQDDFFETKKGKKGKKNKKKNVLSWDEDAPEASEAAASAMPVDVPEAIVDKDETGTALLSSKPQVDDPLLDEVVPEKESTTPADEIMPGGETSEPVPDISRETPPEADNWEAPAKKGKKKKKGKTTIPWDDEPAAEEPSVQSEPTVADESSDLPQADVPAPVTEQPVEVDPTDMWSTPSTSKKDKKKKKKGLQREDSWPTEVETQSEAVAQDPPAILEQPSETPAATDLSSEPVETEQTRDLSSVPEPSTTADAEPDFAPVTKGKKKKKDKKKSMQWEPEPEPEPLSSSAATQAAHEPSVDVTPTEAKASERDVDYYPSSAGLHSPQKLAEEASNESKSYFPSAARLLPAAIPLAAVGSALKNAWSKDTPDQDVTASKDVQDAERTEHAAEDHADKPTFDEEPSLPTDSDKARSLEPHISEPLFSQGEPSIEPTQEESTLGDAARDMTTEPAEDPWEQPSTSKKKGKKNKKKNQVNFWEPAEEPVSEEQVAVPSSVPEDRSIEEPADAAPSVPEELGVEDSAVDPVVEADKSALADVAEPVGVIAAPNAEAEDEWSMQPVGKKSKKGKKKRDKVEAIVEPDVPEETSVDVTQPSSTQDSEAPEEPSVDTSGPPAQQEETGTDDWPQVTGKKSKKKKRQSLPADPWEEEAAPSVEPEAEFETPKKGKGKKKKTTALSWDLDAEQTPEEPREAPADVLDTQEQEPYPAPTVVEPEAEFEVPKKGKGKKKKKTALSWDFDEAEQKPEDSLEGSMGATSAEQPAEDTTVSKAPDVDDNQPPLAKESLDTASQPHEVSDVRELEARLEDLPADDSVPVSSEEVVITPDIAQDHTVPVETSDAPVPAEATHFPDSWDDQPVLSEQPAPSTEDSEFFPLKMSKKDKKNKKKKQAAIDQSLQADSTYPADVGAVPATDPAAQDSESAEQPQLGEEQVDDRGDVADPAPVDDSKTSGEPSSAPDQPVAEESILPGQEPEPNPDDEWGGGFSIKQSKKNKKKKNQKGKDVENETPLEVETATPSQTEPEPRDLAPEGELDTQPKDTERQADEPEVFAEPQIADEPETLQAPTIEPEQPEDASWGFSLSKKDKKKKKKGKALDLGSVEEQSSQEPEAAPQTAPEVDPESKDEDGWNVGLSKKDKKKKKKSKFVDFDLGEDPASSNKTETPEDPQLPLPEDASNDTRAIDFETDPMNVDVTHDLASADEPSVSEKQEQAEEARDLYVQKEQTEDAAVEPEPASGPPTSGLDAPETLIDAPAEPQEAGEDAWTSGTSKKDKKKKKKGKAMVFDMAESVEPSTDVPSSQPDSFATPDIGSSNATEQPQVDSWTSEPQIGVPSETPAQDDETWLAGLSKKEKKKLKKAKASGFADAFEDVSPPQETVREDEPVDEPSVASEIQPEQPDEVSTEEPPAAREPEPEPEQNEPDDFWSAAPSKKDKKKKKKGKRDSQIDVFAEPASISEIPTPSAPLEADNEAANVEQTRTSDDAAQPTPIQDTWEEPAEKTVPEADLADVLEEGKGKETSEQQDPSVSQDMPAPDSQTDKDFEDADAWAMPQRKLSKKDKKKMKQATYIPEDVIEPAQDNWNGGDQIPESEEKTEDRSPAEQETREAPAVSEETPAQSEDWFTPGMSKKERKKAEKRAMAAAAAAAAAGAASLELMDESKAVASEEQHDKQPAEEPSEPREVLSWADDMNEEDNAREAQAEVPLEDPQPAESVPADDDFGGFLVSKKKKKGKKGKAGSSTPTTPADNTLAEPEPPADAPALETVDVQREDAIESASTSQPLQREPTPQAVEPPQAMAEDDEWALPAKRKGKKGKKAQSGSGTMTPTETVEQPPAASVNDARGDATGMDIVDEPSVAPQPMSTEPEDLPPAGKDDDMWALPAKKKKGKKDKKGASSGTMTPATEEPEMQTPMPEAPTELPEEETRRNVVTETPEADKSVQEDDEWALPTKKKGKKGKKAKGVPFSAFEESPSMAPPNEPSGPSFDEGPDPLAVAVAEEAERAIESGELKDDWDVTQTAGEQATTEPAEANPDDMWATPAKKGKGKKKNRKSTQDDFETPPTVLETPVEASAPITDNWEQDAAPAQDASQPQEATDDWLEGFSTSKSKKKKNKAQKAAAQAPTPPTEDPVSESTKEQIETSATQESAYDKPNETPDLWDDDDFFAPKERAKSESPKKPASPQPQSAGWDFSAINEPTQEKAVEDTWQADASPNFVKDVSSQPEDPVRGESEPAAARASPERELQDDIPPAPVASEEVMQPSQEEITDLTPAQERSHVIHEAPFEEPVARGKKKKKTKALQDVSSPDNGPSSQERSAQDATIADASRDIGSPGKDPKEGMDSAEAALAAGAAAGGVASIAAKFGGSKKKTKGKKKKLVDKRQSQEEDIFDDPALWEGADRKTLDTDAHQVAGEGDDFWNGGNDEPEPSQDKELAQTPMNESFTESEGGFPETARQGARLDDDEFAESPVLGRGENTPARSGPVALLRRGSSVEEPSGGLLEEDRQAPPEMEDLVFDTMDFRRSPTRTLPVVQEVPEVEGEMEQISWESPDINRDSGFVAESPNPLRRSIPFDDEAQRDSGVHTGDWRDGEHHATPRTPEPSTEKRLRRSPAGASGLREPTTYEDSPEPPTHRELSRSPAGASTLRERAQRETTPEPPTYSKSSRSRSPFSTPVLREPPEQQSTPEPTKRSSKKQYGSLGSGGGATTAAAAATVASTAAATAAATGPRSSGDSVASQRSRSDGHQRLGSQSSPQPESMARRSASNTSLSRQRTPEPLKFRPESPGINRSTPTPPLRRVNKSMSSDLRALRQQSNTTPVANEGRVRTKDMTDVYDGYGEGRIGSPRSPTRPHSMRRRQSMQVLELESKVEQLIAENRLLTDARAHAEQNVSQRAASALSDRDAEIESLKQSLQFLNNEVSRLTEVNEGLSSANAELASKSTGHADISRELEQSRGLHTQINQTVQEKDAEIADLRAQLEAAQEQVRDMQRQILASKAADAEFLDTRDEDYFDNRCQQLCSHVQQWVLRFSKFSDMRACRLTSEINDEKTIDRLDNAVLDGSDVDTYLNDRIKRRDIFMSMTMNMIWEFVFTRYLFGMDREQRQKLKSLEKLLNEVGPPQAVRQWRAVTLTLLARRDSFIEQRDLDTEAVVQAVFQTLCKILPPPGNLEGQIQAQLRRVMAEAVALSIEMRTQKAEYMMLPPLQPEYDADGELAATVQFNASMMNERSGGSAPSNEDLEASGAVVRVVLFPLVVKKGDDEGVGEDEIVVCPAQVLVARDKGKRNFAPSSDAGGASLGAPSHISVVTEHMAGGEGEAAGYYDGGI